jgi:two-component sensor histidine kinase
VKILHLEDNDYDALLILEALRKDLIDCQLTYVKTRAAFVEGLDRGDWDIILSDYSLPGFDGESALKLAVEKCPDVPFIFVAGTLGDEVGVESLKNGAADYVLKNRLSRLGRAVDRARLENESARARKQEVQRIKDSLREKELLLQEVHHRVNNNLQIVCSLIGMQADAAGESVLANALRENLNRIRSMASVHAIMYESRSFVRIDFPDYIRLLAADLSCSYGPTSACIQVRFELAPMMLEIDRAIPCGLILNELLSNAFKHAFPNGRKGEVCISLKQEAGYAVLTVADNGIGLPKGWPPDEAKTVGLRVARILGKQLGGTLDASCDGGSRFDLKLPVTK